MFLAGFMMTRMLGSAPIVADAIVDQLSRPTDKATDSGEHVQQGLCSSCTAAHVWCGP